MQMKEFGQKRKIQKRIGVKKMSGVFQYGFLAR